MKVSVDKEIKRAITIILDGDEAKELLLDLEEQQASNGLWDIGLSLREQLKREFDEG